MATPYPGSSNLCIGCGIKPRFQEGAVLHPYCGRSCAAKLRNASTSNPPPVNAQAPQPSWSAFPAMPPMAGICQLPMCSKPVYQDPRTGASRFCSKAHMNQAATNGPGSMQGAVPAQNSFSSSPKGTCQLPGCTEGVWIDAKGTPSQYCGKKHRDQHAASNPHQAQPGRMNYLPQPSTSARAVPPPPPPPASLKNPCLSCGAREQHTGSPFCGNTCLTKAQGSAPGLLEIPSTHATFKSVADQFTKKWAGGSSKTVKHVYIVLVSTANMKKFHGYRQAIEAKRQCASTGLDAGNQQRRWHGTKRSCNIGDPGHTKLCSSTSCALCSIIRSSFSMTYASSGCFGKGIYTSSTSSKSDGYSSNLTASPLKAMLLNKVIVGRGYNLNSMNSSLTAPPSGYDSVLGQLGNDELIVYTEDAIRPAYLLMYA